MLTFVFRLLAQQTSSLMVSLSLGHMRCLWNNVLSSTLNLKSETERVSIAKRSLGTCRVSRWGSLSFCVGEGTRFRLSFAGNVSIISYSPKCIRYVPVACDIWASHFRARSSESCWCNVSMSFKILLPVFRLVFEPQVHPRVGSTAARWTVVHSNDFGCGPDQKFCVTWVVRTVPTDHATSEHCSVFKTRMNLKGYNSFA